LVSESFSKGKERELVFKKQLIIVENNMVKVLEEHNKRFEEQM